MTRCPASGVPRTLAELVAERLAALRSRQQQVLVTAAIVGGDPDRLLMADVSGEPESRGPGRSSRRGACRAAGVRWRAPAVAACPHPGRAARDAPATGPGRADGSGGAGARRAWRSGDAGGRGGVVRRSRGRLAGCRAVRRTGPPSGGPRHAAQRRGPPVAGGGDRPVAREGGDRTGPGVDSARSRGRGHRGRRGRARRGRRARGRSCRAVLAVGARCRGCRQVGRGGELRGARRPTRRRPIGGARRRCRVRRRGRGPRGRSCRGRGPRRRPRRQPAGGSDGAPRGAL